MKSFEFTGKNVEKAIESGLKELNKRAEEVDIKIISDGGLFKKARVQISFEDKQEDIEIFSYEKSEVTIINEDENKVEVFTASSTQVNDEPEKVKTKSVVIDKKENVKTVENNNDVKEFLNNYLTGLINKLGVDGKVEIIENEENITATISSENCSKLIGYRGECLNAIQYLTNLSTQQKFKNCKRIYVDIENYREKREQSLKNLAERIARKVERTGKPQRLEPMTPNERRIIHTHLQENKNVETQSSGVEPRRFLTVYPRGYDKK